MARRFSEDAQRRREGLQQRVAWVLDHLFGGKQRRMAAEMGMTQSLISRIVNGHQGAGPEFVEALKRLPGLNPRWVDAGEGAPLVPPTKGTLPVARGILPGEPASYPELLTGERHPVAEAFERSSRYWIRLIAGAPALSAHDLALLPGDLLLFDANARTWEGHLTEYAGQLCGVRLSSGVCEMGRLKQDAHGLVCQPFEEAAGKPSRVSVIRRRLRSVVLDPAETPAPQRTTSEQDTAVEDEIVAVRVYTVRP